MNFYNRNFYSCNGITNGYKPGAEPLYRFNATVYQVYLSMFF